MKDEMEKLVPGITRSIISKGGAGVDGKYNQDLHPSLILIELGGIGNSEEELNQNNCQSLQRQPHQLFRNRNDCRNIEVMCCSLV